jgi:hypothetical protein
MRKLLSVLVGIFLSFTLSANNPGLAQDAHPIMRPNRETLVKWMIDYQTAPKALLDSHIDQRLKQAAEQRAPTSLNLLNYLQYNPSERNQRSCGNCWVWTGTGIMEIALNVQNGIKDRFSIQFFDSCYSDTYYYACCGGNITDFANWYGSKGYTIPWSNPNASWSDSGYCGGPITRTCGSITSTPRYPITSITAQTISTTGVGQAAAVANIKNILHQNKAVWYAFFLNDFTPFDSFWDNQNETALWNPDLYCLSNANQGHAVLVVGYDDSAPDPANHYLIVLNSWGAPSNRPNGLFRVKMYMNYDCSWEIVPGYPFYNNQFMTLNLAYPNLPLAITGSATSVGTTSATLNGTVNPRGLFTTYWFEWGKTSAYGWSTPAQAAGSGTGNVAVTSQLTGLSPGTTYHYRLAAGNSAGTAYGAGMVFKTDSSLPFMFLLLN